ncbi:TPA_asm: PolB, partial [Coelastrella green algae MELD virus]
NKTCTIRRNFQRANPSFNGEVTLIAENVAKQGKIGTLIEEPTLDHQGLPSIADFKNSLASLSVRNLQKAASNLTMLDLAGDATAQQEADKLAKALHNFFTKFEAEFFTLATRFCNDSLDSGTTPPSTAELQARLEELLDQVSKDVTTGDIATRSRLARMLLPLNLAQDYLKFAQSYTHAHMVYNTFQCRSFEDYHDLYLMGDVLMLADLMEGLRRSCLEVYQLDPVHYFGIPGLTYDAMLLFNQGRNALATYRHPFVKKVMLMVDPHMLDLSVQATRGGICGAKLRYAEANNKYLHDFDPNKCSVYIVYLDANNLYGWAMMQHLPTGGYRWLSTAECETFLQQTLPASSDTGPKGWIIRCHLCPPGPDNKGAQDKLKDYPPASENKVPPSRFDDNGKPVPLSPYMAGVAGSTGHPKPGTKLIQDLTPKEDYVVHYRNLKYLLSLGYEVKQIHEVIEFDQAPWLADYIQFNTDMRNQAKKDKDATKTAMFKLFNNSLYGRMCMNILNRINFKLVWGQHQRTKTLHRPDFVDEVIFTEGELSGMHLRQGEAKVDTMNLVGTTILELSKLHMMQFHYGVMQPKFGDGLKLCYTDTDSLVYQITVNDKDRVDKYDLYQDMSSSGFSEHFDRSEYKDGLHHFQHAGNSMVGKFKDEVPDGVIRRFVALRAKAYAFEVETIPAITSQLQVSPTDEVKLKLKVVHEDGETSIHKKAKGVSKQVTNKGMFFDEYMYSLNHTAVIDKDIASLQSKRHQMQTLVQKDRACLSPYEDKHYWLNAYESVPFGHYLAV